MKVAIVFVGLLTLGLAAPQRNAPRKIFHEHFDDFMDVVTAEAGDEITSLMEHYSEFEEFWAGLHYLKTNSFRDLVNEMESLPEFKAVVEFLENDNIDILYFIDFMHEAIDQVDRRTKRHEVSGRDLTAFIRDVTSALPKKQLSALYDQKVSEDEEFRTSMENLNSVEWQTVLRALLDSEVFQNEAQTLADHGIAVEAVLDEIKAIFGQ